MSPDLRPTNNTTPPHNLEDIKNAENSSSAISKNDNSLDGSNRHLDNEPYQKNSVRSGLYNAGLNTLSVSSPYARALKFFLKKHKKGSALGGIVLIIIMLIVLGFSFIVSHELIDIEKTLLNYEAKVEQYFEKKAAKSLFNHIFCRTLSPGSASFKLNKCNTGDEGDNKDSSESQADENGALSEDMSKFDFTNDSIKTALEANNIKVETDSAGNFKGLTDLETNQPITIDDINNNVNNITDKIETALPEWDIGQIKSFIPVTENHAQSSYDVVPDSTDDNADKDIETVTTNGVQEDVTPTTETPDKNASQQQITEDAQGAEISGNIGGAVNTAEQAMANGASEASALRQAMAKFGISKDPATIMNMVSDLCSVQQAATNGAKSRVPKIMSLLIRHATTLISLADQIKVGHITGNEVGQIMRLFNGDSSAPPTTGNGSHKIRNIYSLPFSASAAWQRMTGNPVNSDPKSLSYTPDLANSARPTANAGTKIVNEVNGIIPGGGLTCSIVSSPIGGIVGGLVGVFQITSDEFTLGASQVAIIAGNIGLTEFLQNVIIPEIIKYFTPIGLNGNESSTEWMNNADAGANLAFNNYAQSLGAQPVSKNTANKQFQIASAASNKDYAEQPLAYKLFAVSNPGSLVSHFILNIPTSTASLISDMKNYFSNLPSEIFHDIASIIQPRIMAASQPQNPGQPYGITQYGFGDITEDPIAVENFLHTSVSYNGNTATRLSLLGDPNLYNNSNPDPSQDDVLHCFLQGYNNTVQQGNTIIADQTTGNNDPICGSVGSYDYDNDTPEPIGASQVAMSYCEQLDPIDIAGCVNSLLSSGQVTSKDINYFSQYILDVHVMNDYLALTTNS